MHLEIHRASGGQYYWRIVGNDGKTLATSEGHYTKADARSEAELVLRSVGSATIRDRA